MFAEAKSRAGGFLSQCVGEKEEIRIIRICWILLRGRGDMQLSPKEGTGMGLWSQILEMGAQRLPHPQTL